MPDVVEPTLRALARAEALLRILDREHSRDELYRHVRGVRHEVQTARDHIATLGRDILPPRDGKVPENGRATSKSAARAVRTRSGSQRHQVLRAVARESLTDPELMDRTGIIPNSLRPRRLELVEAGYIEPTRNDANRVITRPNAHNRPCIVWRITPKGTAALSMLEAGQLVFTDFLDRQFGA